MQYNIHAKIKVVISKDKNVKKCICFTHKTEKLT